MIMIEKIIIISIHIPKKRSGQVSKGKRDERGQGRSGFCHAFRQDEIFSDLTCPGYFKKCKTDGTMEQDG